MPKIIENLESRLIAEAQKQIEEAGYSAMTMRSVAKACGVGVGTVYNYYNSKEQMLATFLLKDWDCCISAITQISSQSDSPVPVLKCVYDQLHQFNRSHQQIFKDEAAVAAVAAFFSRFHALLRTQLAKPLYNFFPTEFEAEFIIEALLTWTMAGKSFDEIMGMIGKLL